MNRLDKHNMVFAAVGEGLWGMGASFVLPAIVLVVLLQAHGAGKIMIGAVSSIEVGGLALLQLLGPFVLRSRRRRKRHLLMWHLLLPVPFWVLSGVFISQAAALGDGAVRWGLLACHAGRMVSIGVIVAVWSDWLAHLFDTSIRGRALGLSLCLSSLAGAVALSVSGFFLRRHGPAVYPYLFWGAAAAGTLSMAVFWRVRDPAEHTEELSLNIGFGNMMGRFRDSLRDSNFRAFLVGRLLAAGGFSVAPMIVVHFMSPSGGGLSQGAVVSLGVALPIGSGLGNLLIGRLGDAKGHRLGMLLGLGMQIVTLTLLLTSRGAVSCLLVYACSGAAIGMGLVSHFNLLFETCPHDSRLSHITVGNLVCSAGTAAAPMVAGWVAAVWGCRPLFAGSLALSVVALAWFALFVRDPRHDDRRRINLDTDRSRT